MTKDFVLQNDEEEDDEDDDEDEEEGEERGGKHLQPLVVEDDEEDDEEDEFAGLETRPRREEGMDPCEQVPFQNQSLEIWCSYENILPAFRICTSLCAAPDAGFYLDADLDSGLSKN